MSVIEGDPSEGGRDEVQALRAELAALRAEMEEMRASLRGEPSAGAGVALAPPATARSRREVLRRWGAAGVGAAVAGTAVFPGRAAATPATPATANNQALSLGNINTCTQTTELKFPGFPNEPFIFSHVLAVQDGVWSTPRIPYAQIEEETGSSAGVAGLVGAVVMHGGFFQTNCAVRGSAGVKARGETANAYGVWAAGRRAALRLERLPLQIPPTERADIHNEGEFVIDDNSDLWYCVEGGQPGTWLKLAGPRSAGQFHPIQPARVYDSRYTAAVDGGVGPIQPGTSRTISVANAFTVNSASTSITDVVPAGATAVAYNLTVAATGPAGYLSLNPGDATEITASSINWSAPGTVLGNASVVKLDGFRQVRVFCFGSATDMILDVVGYYR